MKNIFEQLTDLLIKDERLVSQNGELLKNQTQELARKNDPELIKLLLSDKAIKQHFFFEVEKTLIFDKEKFIRFISNKQFLPDSYTAFKNKIGLTAGDEYLSESKEVVLAWPYKDCVLEGGMTKEDQKRDEIFYNETLAPDDINRLLDAKVFTNFKRIDKKGEHKLDGFKRDEKGTIKDNLIIKGNNLLALASLKKEFAGKVKLIYIDPPYNTGDDSFGYNDSFNHSTWLTFMKNRLMIAYDLLDKDGVIFVSINHIELAYVSILLDEIFGRGNKLPIITLKAGTTASYRSINDCPVNVTEYVLVYSRTQNFKPNPIYRETGYSEDYSHYIENLEKRPEHWNLVKITDLIHKQEGCKNWREYKIKFGSNWKRKRFEAMEEFAFQNKEKVVSLNTLQKPSKNIQEIIDKSKNTREKVFSFSREGASPIYCFNGRTLAFFSSKFRNIEGDIVPSEILTNLWTDISFLGIGPEGGVTMENGKKPEYLLKTIIELVTKKNDIVLDYHLGSGTTAAVSHKMGRQYIGIEQLNYGDNDSVVRLQNVINGDSSGISDYENIKWQGGGDFVYMELAKWNEEWIEKIEKAKTGKELAKIWDEMKETAFLSYKVDPKTVDANAKDFADLIINDQKKFLIECLDKNQLYVNLSEIEDKEYGVSKEDIKLNKEFYE